ncbi:MAG: Calx-beta domain-containing protein [Planctomycetota bacterium]|nr:Calx-beta domain-containing protein [Planctomycetota bacterium]
MTNALRRLLVVCAAATAVGMVCAADDDNLFFAYEGFAYAHTQAPPYQGGVGWAGPWIVNDSSRMAMRLAQPAFSYDRLNTANLPPIASNPWEASAIGDVHAENAAANDTIKRRIAAPLTECWVSMLLSMKGADSVVSFDYFNGLTETVGYRLRVDQDGTWRLENADGSASVDTGIAAYGDNPRLLVVQMTHRDVRLYINPAYGWQSPQPQQAHAVLSVSQLGDRMLRLEQLRFRATEQFKVDEIRIATAYEHLWYEVPPPLPTVYLQVLDEILAEPDNRAVLRVGRQGLSQVPLTVFFDVGGSAIADVDYRALPDSVVIPAGMLSNWVDIEVLPVDDEVVEDQETIIVRVRQDGRYQLGTAPEAVLFVQDNDQLPRVWIAATDPTAREAEWPVDWGTISLYRDGLLQRPLTVHLAYGGSAIPGRDYETLPSSITFQPGQRTFDLLVKPLLDSEVEGNETVEVSLIPQPHYWIMGTPTATVTIRVTDQGSGTVAAESALQPIGEGCGAGAGLALCVLPFTMLLLPRRR